jgi:predicted oxidoreductase
MKAYGGMDVYIHIFLTLELAGGEWSASRRGRFTPGERAPRTHWIRGWVDPRVGLDDVEKRKFLTLLGLKLQPLSHQACS